VHNNARSQGHQLSAAAAVPPFRARGIHVANISHRLPLMPLPLTPARIRRR